MSLSGSASGAQVSRRREVTKEIALGFGLVSPNVVRDVLKALKYPTIGTKTAMVQNVEDIVMKHGIHLLLSKMKKLTLKQISLLLDCEPKQRAIQDIIVKHGLPAFLQQKCDVKLLQECCRLLGLDLGSAFDSASREEKTSEDLEREIADEVMLMGTDEMLRSLPLHVLTEVARDLGILAPITDPSAPPPTYGPDVTVLSLASRIMEKVFDLVPLQQYLEMTNLPSQVHDAAHSPLQAPPAKRAKIDHATSNDNGATDFDVEASGAASSSAAAFISAQNAVRRSKKAASSRLKRSDDSEDAEGDTMDLTPVPKLPKSKKTVRGFPSFSLALWSLLTDALHSTVCKTHSKVASCRI